MSPALFLTRCQQHGVARARCGPKVRDLLLSLQREPLRSPKRKWNRKSPALRAMPAAITHGFALYDRHAEAYRITPAGEQWLASLAAHGLA